MNDWKKYPASLDDFESMREQLNDTADSARLDPATMMKLELGFEEAVVNVINYSGSENIWIKITDGDSFTVELVDHGIPFNPLEKHDARAVDTSDIEERKPGGFGIEFMRRKFSKVEYSDAPFMGERANRLTMTFKPKG